MILFIVYNIKLDVIILLKILKFKVFLEIKFGERK